MRLDSLFANLLILVVFVPDASLASEDVCWDASLAASTSNTWKEFREAFERCTYSDGVYAEMKAEGVTRLLTVHWPKLPELNAIANKDPIFLQQVLDYLDDTTPQDEAAAIYKSATEKCPHACEQLCARIADRVRPERTGTPSNKRLKLTSPGEV